MAVTTIKSTYSLDVETVRTLESIARRWRVSKSEALRRAIRSVAGQVAPSGDQKLAALDALQRGVRLTRPAAARWQREVRTERRASATRRRAR